MAIDPLVSALKAALTPDPDRLPKELFAAIIADYGQRVGMKEARNQAEAYVHPDAMFAIHKVLARDKENAKRPLMRAAVGAKRKFLLVKALLQIDDNPIAETIIRDLLRDPSDPTFVRIVQIVGQAKRPERFLPELHELASQHGSEGWAFAILAIGFIGHRDSTTVLIPQWNDQPESIYVLTALRSIAAEDAQPIFVEATQMADLHTRLNGLWGLAKLGDAEAAKTLVTLIDHPDSFVTAARALADIHNWPFEYTAKSVKQCCNEIAAKAKVYYGL